MYSFLILTILVTPNENRNTFNYVTSISASCLFVSATVSNLYNIAGLTATLYTFPFTLAGRGDRGKLSLWVSWATHSAAFQSENAGKVVPSIDD